MEVKNARLIKICDAQEGVSQKSGNAWRKVTAVLETTDHYPKTIAAFSPGALLNVTFDVESRCWVNPNTNEERMMSEESGRDTGGCLWLCIVILLALAGLIALISRL